MDESNENEHEIWRFKLKDIPKFCHQIVIPEIIYQEYANKFEETMDKQNERLKDEEEEVKIEKVKKSVRKKINVDFGDDEEDSLF